MASKKSDTSSEKATPIALSAAEVNQVVTDEVWRQNPFDLSKLLRERSQQEIANPARARGWDCLAKLAYFKFDASNYERPFSPMLVTTTGASVTPNDLQAEELAWLKSVAAKISCVGVRARMGDVLWLRNRDIDAARLAIEAYLALSLSSPLQATLSEGTKAVRRACQIGRQIIRPGQAGGSNVFKTVLNRASQALRAGDWEDALQLLAVLAESNAVPQKTGLTLLKRIVRHVPTKGDGFRWQAILGRVESVAATLKENVIVFKMRRLLAESHERTAKADEKRSEFLRAAMFWQQALEAHRRAGSSRVVSDRVQKRLIGANEKARPQMQSYTSSVNVKPMVLDAVKRIAGHPPLDAVMRFAHLVALPDLEKEREDAVELIEKHPLHHLVTTMRVDNAGRSMGIAPSYSGADAEREKAIREQILETRGFHWQICAIGTISPALQVLHMEHADLEDVLRFVVSGCSLFPQSRLELVLKGILAGADSDFATAASLLIPQLENMIRHQLELKGVTVTRVNQDGGQEDRTLGSLLGEIKLREVFPDNVIDELRALLDERGGPRLRHGFAHGRLSPQQLRGNLSIYCWWLCLRIVAGSFLDRERIRARDSKAGNTVA